MRLHLNKVITILILFLLCANIIIPMSTFLDNNRSIFLTDHSQSYSNISNGSGALTLKVGAASGPRDLDPINSWDSFSNDVIEQVAEGLFSYNYSDVNLPRINLLAQSYWWENNVTLRVQLRQGIQFHDGTSFNATAAKWNFDRINYFINATGTLPGTVPIAQTESLWRLPNGEPIINNTATVGDYNITITLNGVFSPFLDLLCYTNAYMLSPTSTPATDWIVLTTGDLVGTGPFTYVSYTPDVEVRFTRFDNYWRGPAYFYTLIFVIIEDATARSNAMLTGMIDYVFRPLPSLYDIFEANTTITVKRFTEETGKASLIYHYLGINNHRINKTMRQAMAWAFPYDYMLEVMLEGFLGIRAYSPISPGFGPIYNESVNYPYFDLAKARQILLDAGVVSGLTANNDTTGPVADAWKAAGIATYNYTANIGNAFREGLLVVLQDAFSQIGITVTDNLMTWSEFLDILLNPSRHDELELYFIGWFPDYLDPWNMLDPLFNPASASNSAQVNDPYLTALLQAMLEELDPDVKNDLVKHAQWYFAENSFHLYAYHPTITAVHAANLKGVAYNAMDKWQAYPIYRELGPIPGPFTLLSTAEDPDEDGEFDLVWSDAEGAVNYSIYQYHNFITEINGSLIPLATEITDLTIHLSGYATGTYYFIVVAHNEYGDTLSNCKEIIVDLPLPGNFILLSNAGDPDDDGEFDLVWSDAEGAVNYSVYQYHNFITEINGSLIPLATEITDLTIPLSEYTNGTYYFVVVAHNEYGDTLSNCIEVEVAIPPTKGEPEIPGYNLLLIVAALGATITLLLKKKHSTI